MFLGQRENELMEKLSLKNIGYPPPTNDKTFDIIYNMYVNNILCTKEDIIKNNYEIYEKNNKNFENNDINYINDRMVFGYMGLYHIHDVIMKEKSTNDVIKEKLDKIALDFFADKPITPQDYYYFGCLNILSSHKIAKYYFKKGIKFGSANCALGLAQSYTKRSQDTNFSPFDSIYNYKMKKYYIKASNLGSIQANNYIAEYYIKMSNELLEPHLTIYFEKAEKYLLRSINQNIFDSMRRLGNYYLNNKKNAENYKKGYDENVATKNERFNKFQSYAEYKKHFEKKFKEYHLMSSKYNPYESLDILSTYYISKINNFPLFPLIHHKKINSKNQSNENLNQNNMQNQENESLGELEVMKIDVNYGIMKFKKYKRMVKKYKKMKLDKKEGYNEIGSYYEFNNKKLIIDGTRPMYKILSNNKTDKAIYYYEEGCKLGCNLSKKALNSHYNYNPSVTGLWYFVKNKNVEQIKNQLLKLQKILNISCSNPSSMDELFFHCLLCIDKSIVIPYYLPYRHFYFENFFLKYFFNSQTYLSSRYINPDILNIIKSYII